MIAPVLVVLGLAAAPSFAHEFWISPETYQVAPGDTIRASFRNGENFKGVGLAFFDRRSARLDLVAPDGALTPLTPRNGDRPAVVVPDAPDGLVILAHETTPSGLTYREWAKFVKFATHKDFPDIAARQDARGLPRENFKEGYTRHVKALIGVGDAQGADRALGLQTEFIALTNPYMADFTQNMKVELHYKGQPRPDVQVEIFDKAPDGTVEIRLTRTDAEGRATFQTTPGHHYLIDAVVLREPERAEDGIAWETLWAGLTFAVPD